MIFYLTGNNKDFLPMATKESEPFWIAKTLAELNSTEWESLCDGCGHCCLVKLADEDTDKVYTTNVACRLLDMESCTCQDYNHRAQNVSACLLLSIDKPELFKFLPTTCAYRCLYEKRPLPEWHHLISRDRQTVHENGLSIRDFAVSEEYIHPQQLEDHIISEILLK